MEVIADIGSLRRQERNIILVVAGHQPHYQPRAVCGVLTLHSHRALQAATFVDQRPLPSYAAQRLVRIVDFAKKTFE